MTRDPPKFNMQDAAWIPDEELAGKVFMIHGKRKWPGKFYGISNCKAIPTIAPKRLLPKNLPVCSRSQTFSLADMEPFLIILKDRKVFRSTAQTVDSHTACTMSPEQTYRVDKHHTGSIDMI